MHFFDSSRPLNVIPDPDSFGNLRFRDPGIEGASGVSLDPRSGSGMTSIRAFFAHFCGYSEKPTPVSLRRGMSVVDTWFTDIPLAPFKGGTQTTTGMSNQSSQKAMAVKPTKRQPRILPYDPLLKELARHQRKNPTTSEQRLWQMLRRKQMRGYSFYRQRPIDQYIVDFYCPDLMLAVEVNGDSHAGRLQEDLERQQRLESLGVSVLRFDNLEILYDMENVLRAIRGWIDLYVRREEQSSP